MDRPALNASMSSATAVPQPRAGPTPCTERAGDVREDSSQPHVEVLGRRRADLGHRHSRQEHFQQHRQVVGRQDPGDAGQIGFSQQVGSCSAPCPCRAPAGAQVLYQRRIGSLALNGCRAPSRCIHPWAAESSRELSAPADGATGGSSSTRHRRQTAVANGRRCALPWSSTLNVVPRVNWNSASPGVTRLSADG
jgi:hypothetical protein